MTDADDYAGAEGLAVRAQLNALVSLLIEKGVLTDADAYRMLGLAIESLNAGPVVQTADPNQREMATKLLEFSRSAMRHTAQEALQKP